MSKNNINEFVKKWMESHESETFVKDKYGRFMYTAGHSSLNLVSFFENLLEDYINESISDGNDVT